MLVLLMLIAIIFIPVYAVFYRYTNYSDEHPWAKKMMKGWLIVASVIGIVFTFFFMVFLYTNLVMSGMCFYANELLVNNKDKSFITKYQSDLQIENEKLIKVINNCFDPTTAKFSEYFNLNGEITTEGGVTTQDDIRTKPKETTETTSTNDT